MVLQIVSILDQKHSFLGKFGRKSQNCQFELKFSAKNDSSMQNFMVVFTFPLLDRKYSFTANLVRKIKVVRLS